METGFRFRCYPTPEQEKILLQWIGHQRFIYNAKVLEDRYFRAFKRKFVANAGECVPIDQKYSHFIGPDTAWLRDVPSRILRNGAVRWKQAYSRFFKRLGGRPKLKKKRGRQSVWITRELFRFEPVVAFATGEITGYDLHLGTERHPVGRIRFKAHKDFEIPASITISVEAGRWFISFSNEDENGYDPVAIGDRLAALPDEELTKRVKGADRGVAVSVYTSDGEALGFTDTEQKRLAKKERRIKRLQKKLARCEKGSKSYHKVQHSIARVHQYCRNVREDRAHKISRSLVDDPNTEAIAFEDLKVQNMTTRPKPRPDGKGGFERNGACAKSGLNRAILSRSWGRIRTFTEYKARRAGKLVLWVPAHHTSQECAKCHHTHPDNRPSQDRFVCQRCGHTDNADHNAAVNIRQRGIEAIREGMYRPKARKKTMRLRTKGRAGTARTGDKSPTPVEIQIRRGGQQTVTHGSSLVSDPSSGADGVALAKGGQKPETPSTAAPAA